MGTIKPGEGMNSPMYNLPIAYINPYCATVNTPMYFPDYAARTLHEHHHKIIESVFRGIKTEASAIELYRQLAEEAPNQEHKMNLVHALQRKEANLADFNALYTRLTGTNPVYQIDRVHFDNYEDGIQKVYETVVRGLDEYQRSYSLIQHPEIRHLFLSVLAREQESAGKFRSLQEEVFHRRSDYGPNPFVVNIEEAAKNNNNFRTALWTGSHLQVTLMSINPGEDIGLENHPNLDQFLRIEEGEGLVQMGERKENLDFVRKVHDDYAIVIPAGTWHNLTNTGNKPIKLYSIYAPPQHPFGTVHETKAIAMAAEEEEHHQ